RGYGVHSSANGCVMPKQPPPRPHKPAWPLFKRAVGLLSPHRLLVAAFIVAITISSLTGLVAPLFVLRIIDETIPNRDAAELNLLIGLLFVIILIGAINAVAQGWLASVISQSVMHSLRT